MDEQLPESNRQLINRFVAGDQKTFEAVISRYEHWVYNLAYRLVGNSGDAADLSQKIFIQLLRKLHTFRGQSAFSTWLYRVATNLARDFLRRRKTSLELDVSHLSSAGNSAQIVENQDLKLRVQQAIIELPIEQRLVIILHDTQGFDYHSVGRVLNISLGTVKSRLSRARARLAKKLAPPREQLRE